jgi:hypothetical protein
MKKIFLITLSALIVTSMALGLFAAYGLAFSSAGNTTVSTSTVSTSTYTTVTTVGGQTVTQTLQKVIQPAVYITIATSTTSVANTTSTYTQTITNSTTCTIWSNGTTNC